MHRLRSFMRLALVSASLAVPSASFAQVVVITIAPPELPVYVQPAIPAPGYIWTPGYWAFGPEEYYWVPGTWIEPPSVGLLWTPGYWGWRDEAYVWSGGYWGPQVGYYGGINYGYGYGGAGYLGGYWNGGVFAYNRTINNFGGVTIVNAYSRTVITNTTVTRVSFNGGVGGTTVKPTPQQLAFANQQHVPATAAQTLQQNTASTNKALLASVNNGKPAVAATSKAGQFTGSGVVAATHGSLQTTNTLSKTNTNTLSKTNNLSTTNPNTLSKTNALSKTNTNTLSKTNANTLSKTNNLSTTNANTVSRTNTNALSKTNNLSTTNANTLSRTNTNALSKTNNLSTTNANTVSRTTNTQPRVNTTNISRTNAVSGANVTGGGGGPKGPTGPAQGKKPPPKP